MRILHTNDFHGSLTAAKVERLMELRGKADAYFDCGDSVKAGNLAIPLKQEEVWPRLAALRCTASVPGNRESHIVQSAFARKIEGHRHPILCANMRLRNGERPLPPHLVFEVDGTRVGVVGVMVPMVTSRMATQAASAFLWDAPIPTAIEQAKELRGSVDCLIALTHIGLRQDRELAGRCQDFDLILGGHSHDVLREPVVVGRTAICQTGSHARFAGLYEWEKGEGLTSYELIALS